MSTLDEKLSRPEQRGGKARATAEQISRMSGHSEAVGWDEKDRANRITRRRWLKDGSLGEPETWTRVDKEFFELE